LFGWPNLFTFNFYRDDNQLAILAAIVIGSHWWDPRPLLTHGWSQNKTTWVVVSPQVFFPDTHSIFRFRHFLPFYFFSF
jgi:hypothetical protein